MGGVQLRLGAGAQEGNDICDGPAMVLVDIGGPVFELGENPHYGSRLTLSIVALTCRKPQPQRAANHLGRESPFHSLGVKA